MWVKRLNRWVWGVSVHPESPPMKPETGRLSATHESKVIKVAEGQNGTTSRITRIGEQSYVVGGRQSASRKLTEELSFNMLSRNLLRLAGGFLRFDASEQGLGRPIIPPNGDQHDLSSTLPDNEPTPLINTVFLPQSLREDYASIPSDFDRQTPHRQIT